MRSGLTREDVTKIVTQALQCPTLATIDTKEFSGVTHAMMLEAVTYWFDQQKAVLGEPTNIQSLQSLKDDGVDILLEGLLSGVKIGFQIKSNKATDQAITDFPLLVPKVPQ